MEQVEASVLGTVYRNEENGYSVVTLRMGRSEITAVGVLPELSAGEQVVLTLMVYMAVLSATLAIRNNSHIRMTCFDPFLPKKLVMVLDIISDILVMILGYVMLKYGWTAAIKLGSRGFYDSLPWLSRFWMYFPIPLAGLAMVIFELERILEHLKKAFVKEEADV